MSHPSNNSDNQHKGANSGQPAKEPASGRNPKAGEGQFCSAKPTVHWVSDGWTCMSWEGADGQPGGYTVTNGQSAMFFDENGNMTFSTGVPGQAGCGGKLILNTGDQLHKASGSIAIQATGGTSEREGSGRTGTGSASSAPPAYSVFAEGGVAIEAQGDECGIKGDNVIIHAIKTLTLKAGELVNIEVGDGSGKFNVFAGDITFDSEFLNENIDGRKKTKGTGEVVVDQQTKLGATHVINSVGTVTHRIRGNYEVEATGRYRVKALGNLNFESTTGGMYTKMAGASYTTIFGPKEEKIYGIKGPTAQSAAPETYKLELGPNAMGMTMKSAGGIGITASIGNSFFANKVGTLNLTAGGTMTMKALTIFLN